MFDVISIPLFSVLCSLFSVLCSLFPDLRSFFSFQVDDCRLRHPKGEICHIFLRSLRPVLLFWSAIRNSMLCCLFVPQIFIFEVSQPPSDDIDSSVTLHRLLRETVRASKFGQWLRL